MRAAEGRHVLQHAEHGHADGLEEVDGLAAIQQRHGLAGGHHHGAAHLGNQLADGQRLVAGAGGRVYHQRVQVAPFYVGEELLEHRELQGAAPDHGRVAFFHDGAHGDQFQTGRGLQRLYQRPVGLVGAALHPGHAGHRGAVYIYIEQAGAQAARGQQRGEVHGYGALAHAALVAHHQDLVLHPGHVLFDHALAVVDMYFVHKSSVNAALPL
jgi:hypothetical protein